MNRERLLKAVNAAVPIIGAGLMVYYRICDTSCSSLKGSLLGLDLAAVGIIAMAVLLVLAVLPRALCTEPVSWLRTAILSGGLGGEVILVRFQVVNGIYCPYCLAFGACLLVLFAVNFPRMDRRLAAGAFLAGVIVFSLFFKGAVLPMYD
jgi:uncharacterized membrane protein